MCCCGGWWSLIRALLLVADMGSDCLNVWDYRNKAYENNENITNFLTYEFYENYNDATSNYDVVLESYYFIISFIAMLLPMVIAAICLLFYLLYVYFMEIRQFFISSCCNAKCGKVFGTIASSLMSPLTFILCVVTSILVIFLSWIVSPLLHIFFAFFIAFGNNPAGNNDSKMKSWTWKKFATLMMFLSIIETVFEAVPQAILGICLSIHQLKHSSLPDNESRLMHLWETYPYQVVSLFFSFCSVVKTLGTVAYQTTNDWDNSIFGMVKVLKNQYKETHQKAKAKKDIKQEKEEEIEMLNDQIKHLETLNNVKQKTIDFQKRFNADLEISGFETGEDGMKRGRFLNDNGIPSELLFDKDKASFPDKSCVLTDLGLPESLRYINKLHGKKYNDSALNLSCSIYIGESKIPSSPNSPSIIPLPISEELEDVETKAKTDCKRKKEEEIDMLNDQIKQLNEDKQKTIDFNNRFNANLKISGFETGNELERGRFLKDVGIPPELLFDKGSFTDKSCVLTDLNLPESLNFMNTLHGKKYNDLDLELNCSIYIVESKIPSSRNSPSIMPLPISEEIEDDENTQLLNGDLQKSMNVKEPKKKRSSFLCWRSNSTSSQPDDSDLELQNMNNEEDVENTQFFNGDLKKKKRFPFLKSKTASQLDHFKNKNDEEVQNTDAKINEETKDKPPTSCPSTPKLLPEIDSQSSDTESTQEIKKEENTGDNK